MSQVEIIEVDADGNEIGRRMADLPAEPDLIVVPAEIANWQARTILRRAGLFYQVDMAVKQSGNEEMLDAWEYAPNVVRRSAFVIAMAEALGLDDATLDQLFIEGAKIK